MGSAEVGHEGPDEVHYRGGILQQKAKTGGHRAEVMGRVRRGRVVNLAHGGRWICGRDAGGRERKVGGPVERTARGRVRFRWDGVEAPVGVLVHLSCEGVRIASVRARGGGTGRGRGGRSDVHRTPGNGVVSGGHEKKQSASLSREGRQHAATAGSLDSKEPPRPGGTSPGTAGTHISAGKALAGDTGGKGGRGPLSRPFAIGFPGDCAFFVLFVT